MMVVVVVLPSEPVTATVRQGQTVKESLHFGGQNTAALLRGQEFRGVWMQARRPEQNIEIEILQIIRSQLQLGAQVLQIGGGFFQLDAGALVAGGHVATADEQCLDERFVADADSQYADSFAPQPGNIAFPVSFLHLPVLWSIYYIMFAMIMQSKWRRFPR
jgi:hypothetical protein